LEQRSRGTVSVWTVGGRLAAVAIYNALGIEPKAEEEYTRIVITVGLARPTLSLVQSYKFKVKENKNIFLK
jgi:hypothetical protein